jgi:hypothetical protein
MNTRAHAAAHTQKVNLSCERAEAESALLAQSERKVFPAHKELHHTSSIVVPVAARRCMCVRAAAAGEMAKESASTKEKEELLAKVNALHAIQP